MLTVHTLEVRPTVDALNESVGEAFLARLRMLIGEAEAPARINLALSGGAVTTSLLPSLLPRIGEVDWSRVRVWLVDERYVPAGDKERNDNQAWEGFFHAATGVEFVRMPTSDSWAPGGGSLDEARATFAATWADVMGQRSFDISSVWDLTGIFARSSRAGSTSTRPAPSWRFATPPSLRPSASPSPCRSCRPAPRYG